MKSVVQVALTSSAVAPVAATVSSSGACGAAAVASSVSALTAAPMADGTVGSGVTDVIAKVRENMVLRRAMKVSASNGIVTTYVHSSVTPGLGGIGVLVALTPKDSKTVLSSAHPSYAALQEVGKKVAMHIAAAKPGFLSRDQVDTASLEREKAVLTEQAKASGKNEQIIAKMVQGRISKYYSDVCLLEQPYILGEDGNTKVQKFVDEASKKAGAPVNVSAFAHFAVGEGVVVPAEGAAEK